MSFGLLIPKADAFFFLIKRKNLNFDLVAGFYNVRGMLDAAPGKIVDMNQSIDSADINKSTEVCQSLYLTCDLITLCE